MMRRILYLCDGPAQEARAIFKARAHHFGLTWDLVKHNITLVPRAGRALDRREVEALMIRDGINLLLIDTFDVSASEALAWEKMVSRHDAQMIAFASKSMLAERLRISPEPDGMVPALRSF